MKTVKRLILGFSLLILIAVGYCAYQIYDRMCWFGLEDNVTYAYSDVIKAIEKYTIEQGKAPPSLITLKPDYLAELPKKPEVIEANYSVFSDSGAWRLRLIVQFHGEQREFIFASDGQLTPDEQARRYIWCHGWEILIMK